jgi:tetratricopeptide (TPR) repeat protein
MMPLPSAARRNDLVLGACYLPIVGDGYLAQGKRDKAFECYRDALAIGTKAMSNVTSDREAVGAQESIAFAVGHAMLMLGQERRASDLVYRMERVGRRFHTLFEQWAFIVNAAPAVATAIDRQILPGDPKLAETLKDKLYPLINGAAYHAAGGHYHRAIQDLRDASVIANKYGLDPDHTLALHAGLLAAGFGEFPEMGEHCLREVVEKSGYRHNRLHAYYNLAIIYRRQGDFAKARAALDEAQKNNVVANTVGDSPKDALHMKQQIGGQRMLLAWLANDWKQMAADWEAVTAKPEDWDRDWWKKWTEAYSFALRQVGRDEDADRALERKETGPSNGKNSGN